MSTETEDGKWTGRPCPHCKGTGQDNDALACGGCGGTGDEWMSWKSLAEAAEAERDVMREANEALVIALKHEHDAVLSMHSEDFRQRHREVFCQSCALIDAKGGKK